MNLMLVSNKVRAYGLGFQIVVDTLRELGHQVVWAADFSNFYGDKKDIPCVIEQIDINTNPFKLTNWMAYKQLCDIINKYKIEGIQCSTPIGGLLARIAGNKMNVSPVIYAAHGFLFFKGAPLINRTIYKWEEKLLAHYTDVIVTITKEDYRAAQKMKIREGGDSYLIHGAGIRVGVEVTTDRAAIRSMIGVPENSLVVISVGELNKNKNNETIIKALAKMKNKNIYYVVCGEGLLRMKLWKLSIAVGVEERVKFLGFRTDVLEILSAADIFVMASYREGLPRALMEAMDAGKPCVVSNIRGCSDLISNGEGGYLLHPSDIIGFAKAIEQLSLDQELRESFGIINEENVKKYGHEIVKRELKEIYVNTFNKVNE